MRFCSWRTNSGSDGSGGECSLSSTSQPRISCVRASPSRTTETLEHPPHAKRSAWIVSLTLLDTGESTSGNVAGIASNVVTAKSYCLVRPE